MLRLLLVVSLVSCPAVVSAQALDELAARLAPGEWGELSTTNMDAAVGLGDHVGNALPFAQNGHWDPVERTLHFLGGDHLHAADHIVYRAADGRWENLGTIGTQMFDCHGYDHAALDPVGRTLFWRPYDTRVIRSQDLSGGAWVESAPFDTDYVQVAIGTAWAPGHGLVVYNCGQEGGQVLVLDGGRWVADHRGFGGTSTYHCFAEASPARDLVVLGGGNANARQLWVFDLAADAIHALPDAPIDLGSSMGIVTLEPNTGGVLALGEGSFLHLDLATETWSTLPAPPAEIADGASVVGTAITDLGIVLYAHCAASTCGVLAYRHAPGSGIPFEVPDAGPGSDAGPGNDAGEVTDAGEPRDGGHGLDAAIDAGAEAGPSAPAGCACRARPSSPAPWALGIALLVAVGWRDVGRRRLSGARSPAR